MLMCQQYFVIHPKNHIPQSSNIRVSTLLVDGMLTSEVGSLVQIGPTEAAEMTAAPMGVENAAAAFVVTEMGIVPQDSMVAVWSAL